jgi:RimJ/RimL family protein N-acetyltransferase
VQLQVREMRLDEVEIIPDYFHQSTAEHLETLGVDPTRLRQRAQWIDYFAQEYGKPIETRLVFPLIWKADGATIGFSTADKIVYGKHAYMHLHIVAPERRNGGIGAACVRESAGIYFEALKIERLFCEPNAFNIAPNRTLQAAGFKYLKTHRTVPGPLNYHHAVTRWVLERPRG